MADRDRSHAENAPGAFFVDETCINCDTCRQVAPLVFADSGDHSFVRFQPVDAEQRHLAARAVLCCPTNSIGAGSSEAKAEVKAALADFPLPVDEGIWYCGFNAENSFGANSYLLRHPAGNWLIDAPRWVPPLAQAIAGLGGIARIFLTHRDDIADAGRYAAHFGARRVIHARDRDACPEAEEVVEGDAPVELAEGLVAIPVPGHTAGSMALQWRDHALFTGDHLWWSRTQGRLAASRSACWHSWSEQARSMRRLLDRRFSWVLPGHGERVRLAPEAMRAELAALVERMGGAGDPDAE
jgi:glyoxylase-like metal-dependent hydrolase (beta-lactamase superfamily II)/ferredoxin